MIVDAETVAALERLGALRIEAFNEVLCGEDSCMAMLVRDEDQFCSAIIAQQMRDQDALDICTVVNAARALLSNRNA